MHHLFSSCSRTGLALIAVLLPLMLFATSACGSPEPVIIERTVVIEVERDVTVEVERVVEVPVTVEVLKEVMVPVEKVVTVEVVKEIVVEKIVEVEKKVPAEVIKEIEATAVPDPTATPITDKVQNTRNLIAAGGSHTCALHENGQVVCWGHNYYGQSSPPPGRFTAISAGQNHTCALRGNGQVECWGINDDGQSSPPGHSFAAIDAGHNHTCGLRENGEVQCWGWNEYGQANPPGGRFIAIASGTWASCGLRESGQMVCWGNTGGVPEGQFIAIDIARSSTYSVPCGLRENGELECRGFSTPEGHSFEIIAAFWWHMCGLRQNNEAMCWGDNGQGRAAAPAGRFADISVGAAHSCGARPSGEVLCWGSNEHGETDVPGGIFALPNTAEPSSNTPSASPAYHSFDAASVLARFSTDDPFAGEARAAAAGEILAYYESGKSEGTRVLELLHTLAPEASIEARRRAADELALLAEDHDWSEADALDAVQHLAEVITGEEINAEGRLAAANEMIERYETGDLDADHALNLLDTIAPGMSINQRRQAAASLARLAADTDWDHSDRMTAASEVFRLVTGVPLDSEQRIDAAVDLTAVGVKIFDTEDNFDDRDIDNAAELIKQAVAGELTTESVNSILASGN